MAGWFPGAVVHCEVSFGGLREEEDGQGEKPVRSDADEVHEERLGYRFGDLPDVGGDVCAFVGR